MRRLNIADPSFPVTTVRSLGVAPGDSWRVAGDGGGYTVVTQAYAGVSFFDTTAAGPPTTLSPLDTETVLEQWRRRRRATSPEPHAKEKR